MKQSIGEFLATLRRAHGYTQQEVADRLSVSNRTVSAWERGAAMPDILLLPALAELYGVTADEILAGERNAGTAPRPALSEKSERKLLKKKINAFFMRSSILFGAYATGLLLFFLGLYVDFSTVVWVGWRWWLLLLILGLVTFLFPRRLRKSGIEDFRLILFVNRRKVQIFFDRACVEGIIRVDVDVILTSRILQDRLEENLCVIGFVFCDRADGIRKNFVSLLHCHLCRELISHARLTFPRKTSCEIVKGLRLGEFHFRPPLR